MYSFICKSFLHGRNSFASSPAHKLYVMRSSSISSVRYFCSTENEPSFVASYLINTFGFSPESALSASKHMNFETPDKPDSVIAFFNRHGFSETQISSLVRKHPPVLLADPEESLSPKLEFLTSKGASSSDVAKIVSGCPSFLERNLEEQIKPSFDFLNNLLQSEEKSMDTIRRFASILKFDFEANTVSNIDTLRECGVPEEHILNAFQFQPKTLTMNIDKFKAAVEEVKRMEISPLEYKFVLAVTTVGDMSKTAWESKVDFYRKLGWSEEDISMAFMKNPWYMKKSQAKVTAVMDIFVKQIGVEPSVVARNPAFLSLSFKQRIVPRAPVAQVLISKGLINKDRGLWKLFSSTEKEFLKLYVVRYEKEVPDISKLYQENLAVQDEEQMDDEESSPAAVDANTASNKHILRAHGVPEGKIESALKNHPTALMTKADRLKTLIEEVKKMGMSPTDDKFVLAVTLLSNISTSEWERKVDAYKKYGWTEEDIAMAFRKHPQFVLKSEDKILAAMDICVKQIGLAPSILAKIPALLTLNLKTRIVPRAPVAQVLVSKGLVTDSHRLLNMFTTSGRVFMKSYFIPYEKEAPGLMKLYYENITVDEDDYGIIKEEDCDATPA